MTDNFYRDIAALRDVPAPRESRNAQAESGATSLNSWIIEQLGPCSGDSVLEVGCGNGRRTLHLARLVGERGYVLAVDRSFDALNTISHHSLEMGLETRIRFLQVSLDEFQGHVRKDDFDRALGSRSLYQLKQPRVVIHAIYRALKPGGVFFCHGPTRRDHAELRRFHAELCGEGASAYESREPTFIEDVGLQCVNDFFNEVEIVKFEHPLCFDSPEALHACWSVSKLYDEELEKQFQQAARRYFAAYGSFETFQRVVGIRAIK